MIGNGMTYYSNGQAELDNGPVIFAKQNGGPHNHSFTNGPGKITSLSNSKTSLQSNGSSDRIHANGFASRESLVEVDELTITVTLESNDRRFGFSVMGGVDEGFPPRIDEISPDSPAARTELEINDEIISVNDASVVEATHAEVIMLIHKCIQKKKITLHVRRYLDDKILSNGGYMNGDASMINEGFTKEMSVDRETSVRYSRVMANKADDSDLPAFINPAFDQDDVSDDMTDEALSSGKGGPRTVPIPTFYVVAEHIKNKIVQSNDQEKVKFLRDLFFCKEFQSAIRAHNNMTRIQIRKRGGESLRPYATNSQFLLSEVRHLVMGLGGDEDANELLRIINKPHTQGLLLAHDRVAMRESLYTTADDNFTSDDDDLSSIEYGPDGEEETVKIVRIDKTNDPLGATVRNDGDAVLISRIVKGGAAEKSGLLHEGDEILEINSIPVKGKNVNEVVEILKELEGTLTFVLIPGDNSGRPATREGGLFFKAQFDYDPQDDVYLPCRELGLAFRKGDILEILNQDDENWWQAKKVEEDSKGLAGLIPSKTFQQQREASKVPIRDDTEPMPSKQKKRCFCIKSKKKKKPNVLDPSKIEGFDPEEVLSYDEMIEIEPDPAKKRPIVLIGPPKVGRRELRQKLIGKNPDQFAPAIPHTSRPSRQGEVDKKDYNFISRTAFEDDIAAHKFVEHGQYEGHYYGTSLSSIRDVVNRGRVCVLNLHCQALPVLKSSDLRPYVVFVTLPSFDQLRRLRGTTGEPFNPNVRIRDEELMDLIEKAREMDINYGHYFDYTIVNKDLDEAFNELVDVANRLETQPQWIPSSWVH